MINLLPPKEKKVLRTEETKRLIVILGSLVLIFFICLILILFSIKFYLQGQAEVQKIILLEREKEFGQSEFQRLQGEIKSINQALVKLKSFYQQKFYFSEIIERISKTLPLGAYLTNVSVNKEKSGFQISLSGFAPSRSILFQLKENLEKEDKFTEINFPPSNWIEANDIDFSLTLKITK